MAEGECWRVTQGTHGGGQESYTGVRVSDSCTSLRRRLSLNYVELIGVDGSYGKLVGLVFFFFFNLYYHLFLSQGEFEVIWPIVSLGYKQFFVLFCFRIYIFFVLFFFFLFIYYYLLSFFFIFISNGARREGHLCESAKCNKWMDLNHLYCSETRSFTFVKKKTDKLSVYFLQSEWSISISSIHILSLFFFAPTLQLYTKIL